ncbi:hypothetical protein [Rubrobacter radiotolerans]|uniref:LrgA family n=1 Tax=Rubrobacter radiotolerans TaxID=42256 RepID=A0AB35SZF5_RUBRA|nr:hypothetical protein [Rubrobacter radiotolerans]MDX5892919.1 hypothetical protein [Rubrobacter radiotolerans]
MNWRITDVIKYSAVFIVLSTISVFVLWAGVKAPPEMLVGIPFLILLAGFVGFFAPRVFWLWGIAIAIPIPPMVAIDFRLLLVREIIEPVDYVGNVMFSSVLACGVAIICTLASAAGAGLRILLRRRAPTYRTGNEVQNGGSAR